MVATDIPCTLLIPMQLRGQAPEAAGNGSEDVTGVQFDFSDGLHGTRHSRTNSRRRYSSISFERHMDGSMVALLPSRHAAPESDADQS